MQSARGKILANVAFVLVTGCARGVPGSAAADLLLLRTPDRLAVMDSTAGTFVFNASAAVPSSDWSTVFRVAHRNSATRVAAADPRSGAEVWTEAIRGELAVGSVSRDGQLAALVTSRRTANGYPEGRSSTTIVFAGPASPKPRHLELAGNYEPEAFSLDRRALFLIQYLPPLAPDRYRVRRLDLVSGRADGVFSIDGHLQTSMRGTARTQVLAPDGKRLYTLYWLAGDTKRGTGRAFIHVLSLDEQWAHCVDLPRFVGSASEQANALALSPDGARLYIADTDSGALAEIDTKRLRVTRTSSVALGGSGAVRANVGPDGTLYLGRGHRLAEVDTRTLDTTRSWAVRRRISGIQAATDGRRVFVAVDDRVVVLDRAAGRATEVLAAAGLHGIDQLGLTSRGLDSARTQILCAC
jgi:hypothetical protein